MSQSPTKQSGSSEALRDGLKKILRMIRTGRSWSGHERNCSFLNTGQHRFANVSAVSGFDFADDGRALAVVDWDHDGDLDLWLTNRTAPRVRFLRNDTPSDNHFLAVHLEGRRANRDAIGARVEVVLRDGSSGDRGVQGSGVRIENLKLVKTLRAGEGFLAQSSKWLHFGLGRASEIERLEVRWPGGGLETFRDVAVDRFFWIVQDSGTARPWTPPQRVGHLQASPSKPPKASERARLFFTARPPLPALAYETFEGKQVEVRNHRGRPLLMNLWASWCLPCVAELKDLAKHEKELRDVGLEVVALCVDGVGQDLDVDPVIAQNLLAKLNFPFPSAPATVELLDKIQLMHNQSYDLHLPLPIPTSILIDEQGRLAAIYKGRVDVAELLADVRRNDLDRHVRAPIDLPFKGRWLGPQFMPRIVPIVNLLLQEGYLREAEEYLARNKELASREHPYVQMLVIVGAAFSEQGRHEDAVDYYRQAVGLKPDHQTAVNNLAWLLATSSDPRIRNGAEAVRWAEQACQASGFQEPLALDTLAAAYAETGRFDEAVETAQKARDLSLSGNDTESAEQIEQRLRLYEEHRPYRSKSVGG